MGEVQLAISKGVLVKASKGCPSHGRGNQRVRSCGWAKKWESAEQPFGMRGGNGDAASTIGVLLSKHSTGYSHMRVNGRKHRAREKVCQSNNLWG
jgi:hypothetical protein